MRVFRVVSRKSKDANDAFSIGGLQVSTLFNETRSGVTNKLCGCFCECGRLAALCECEFVADVAHHDAYVVALWLSVERNSSVAETPKLGRRNAIGKQRSNKMGPVPA